MKIKIASLVINLFYIPLIFYFYYKILETIKASELLWFLLWMLIPIAIVSAILSKLAEWEED